MLKSAIIRFLEARRDNRIGLRLTAALILMAVCVFVPCTYAYADREDEITDTDIDTDTEPESGIEDDEEKPAVSDDDYLIEEDDEEEDDTTVEEGTKKSTGKTGIDAHCVYDFDTETYEFNYTSYDEDDVKSNVYTGMYTNKTVNLQVGNSLRYKIFRDGVELEDVNIYKLQDPGYYALQLLKGNGDVEEVINFTIVGEYSNLTSITMPELFRVKKVTYNEEEIKFKGQTVTFDKEGDYDVEYICIANQMTYHLNARIDHTPPVLALKGVNDEGVARQSISLKDLENGVNMVITLDGEKISNESTLKEFGKYDIILEDKAGNITEYKFEIMMYISGAGIIFMVMFLLVFAGLGTYIAISRKNMKIR